MTGFSDRHNELIQVAGNRGPEWWASQATAAAQVALQSRYDDELWASQAANVTLFRSLGIMVLILVVGFAGDRLIWMIA